MSEAHLDAEWYHGDLARDACERIMFPREPGKFLVRNSNMTRGCYVLSVCGPQRPDGVVPLENYLIKVSYIGIMGRARFTIDDKDYFDDLEQLVVFYRSDAHSLVCPLTKPVSHRTGLNNNSSPLQLNGRASISQAPLGLAQPQHLTSSLSHPFTQISRPLVGTHSGTFQSQMSVNGSEHGSGSYRPYGTATTISSGVTRDFSERSSPFSTLSHTSLNSVASNHSESWLPNASGSPHSSNRSFFNHSRSASIASNNPNATVIANASAGTNTNANVSTALFATTRSSGDTPSSSGSSSLRNAPAWTRSNEAAPVHNSATHSNSSHSFNSTPNNAAGGAQSTVRPGPDSLLSALEEVLGTLERDGWLIDPAELQLSTAQVLGGGEFGEVLRGELGKLPSLRQFAISNRRTERGTIVVAVKKLKTVEKLAEFYSEALLMTELLHANLVRLIGVVRAPAPQATPGNNSSSFDIPVTDTTPSGRLARMNIWIVTEFCSQGDLVNYLRTRGRGLVGAAEQLQFALEVCSAMRFLEAQRIVHRDLAARNVLLDDDLHCKLSDFGLARRLRRDGATVLAGGELLARSVDEDTYKFPVKWTAPEAIRSARYSSQSDVWSFGILLWEIYSFGAMPYKRMQLNDVLGHIERGYRMECPADCPSEMYKLMQLCWLDSPDNRPSFKQLYESISDFENKLKISAVPLAAATAVAN